TNALERLVLTRLNSQPGLLLDYFATLGFRAAIAGVRLGIFDALEKGPAGAAELAGQLGTDQRGTDALLEALTSLHYLRRRGDRYANAPTANKWLTRERDPDFVEATRFLEMAAFDLWGDLEQAVRSGLPVRPFYEWLEADPERSAAFQVWTRWIAGAVAPELVRRAPLPAAARRLIDIGGGHGRYAAAYCRAHAALSAVIFDLPTALRSAEDLLAEPDLAGRIHLETGDFLADDLGADFDVALVINIVHGLSEGDNRGLFLRVAGALNPGGTIVIVEQFTGRAPGPAVNAIQRLLDLNFHLALGGRTYRFADASRWLTDAGFTSPRRINLRSAPGTSLAVAVRPDG
ncbi:MAG TPA: methyltransferase, partial [Candidatus Limnocylindrales bacterium]|nr:methyltransferase [Candidatus Limnocylindrales bacterium]